MDNTCLTYNHRTDDENYDNYENYSNSAKMSVSKAELRKVNKPLMEKRRRARINSCLSQLKMLVLQAVKKDGCSYSKLEKADILEMTVQYLKSVQKNQMIAAATVDPSVINRFTSGYTECTNEAIRYLSSMEGVDKQLKGRLLNHLSTGVMDQVDKIPQMSPPYSQEAFPPNSPCYEGKMFSFEESRLGELQTAMRNNSQNCVTSSISVADDITSSLGHTEESHSLSENFMKSDNYSINSFHCATTVTSRIQTNSTPSSPVPYSSSTTQSDFEFQKVNNISCDNISSKTESVWRPW